MSLKKNTPLWFAACRILADRASDFFRCWKQTAETFDREDIHDLRVASRRLREGLTLFAPCYPAERLSILRRKVRKVTALLGDLRNIDEALAFFRDEAVELGDGYGEELSACIGLYESRREEARLKLKRKMKGMKPGALRKSFSVTIMLPYLFSPPAEAADPFATIEDFARRTIDIRLEPVLALAPLAMRPGEALLQHRLRIAIKRYRYRMEVLSPLMGEGYREIHSHVKSYQDLLGRLHDLDVFMELSTGIDLTDGARRALTELITGKRENVFGRFLDKLEEAPLDVIGTRVRELL